MGGQRSWSFICVQGCQRTLRSRSAQWALACSAIPFDPETDAITSGRLITQKDLIHTSTCRPLTTPGDKRLSGLKRALGLHFNPAIAEVSDPARERQAFGLRLTPHPEENPLHPARDQEMNPSSLTHGGPLRMSKAT